MPSRTTMGTETINKPFQNESSINILEQGEEFKLDWNNNVEVWICIVWNIAKKS